MATNKLICYNFELLQILSVFYHRNSLSYLIFERMEIRIYNVPMKNMFEQLNEKKKIVSSTHNEKPQKKIACKATYKNRK